MIVPTGKGFWKGLEMLGRCKYCGFTVFSNTGYFWHIDGTISHLSCSTFVDDCEGEIEYLSKIDTTEVY